MEESQLKIGLLMEAAEAHQATALAAIESLREQCTGLDAVVREEIRATLLEELAALHRNSQLAAESLRALAHRANRRFLALGLVLMTLACATPVALSWWLLPTPAELAALHARSELMGANVARLRAAGGAADLRRCGTAQRLCARIDRSAPPYGEAADYRVLQGY
ncbi:MAG: hypothetical protein JSR36_09810 [Proteobacteria bacterium]|nr:hypothetical protein [Pseudomonadota bacterium]